MRVALISKPGPPNTGIGRYASTLSHELAERGVEVLPAAPVVPPLPAGVYDGLRLLGADARTFLLNFPVWASYPPADLYHLTSQNLASLLALRPPRGPVVVTVHDILPYMLRGDPQLSVYRTVADGLFDRLAMAGLRRATRLVADSYYTKACIVQHLGIPAERIDVVHLGVDHERFQPGPPDAAISARYGLSGGPYLIYVGSEDPRKNLPMLLRAFAAARERFPTLELIKVGRAHFERERVQLLALAGELGVRGTVRLLESVPEEDLPALYRLAAACVLPSLYEGFGFPALEAMACGTPVIYADAASLPELVGDAGLSFDPGEGGAAGLTAAIERALAEPGLRERLREAGLLRAARFSWGRSAGELLEVYSRLPRDRGRSLGGRAGVSASGRH